MYEEHLDKPIIPIPKPQIQRPASDPDLAEQAQAAIRQFVRHPMGKGVPRNHPALEGLTTE